MGNVIAVRLLRQQMPGFTFRYGGEAGENEAGCRERALFQIEA